MNDPSTPTPSIRVLPAGEGDTSFLGGVRDRFMIDGAETGGRFALVEHLFAPRAMAAPMHRHHDEDEYTYVVTGRIGAVIEGHGRTSEDHGHTSGVGGMKVLLRGLWVGLEPRFV